MKCLFGDSEIKVFVIKVVAQTATPMMQHCVYLSCVNTSLVKLKGTLILLTFPRNEMPFFTGFPPVTLAILVTVTPKT